MTDEQIEAATDTLLRAYNRSFSADISARRVPMRTALRALIALGWRAPGPPTDEEVERAARVKAGPGSRWEALPDVMRGLYRTEAREELTAALAVRP